MSHSAVIASGNRLLRQEIRSRIAQEGILCAGEVSELWDLPSRCQEVRPQVALLDAAYGDEIFQVIEQISRGSSTAVIVLGEELDAGQLRKVMQSGARDFILVRSEGQRLGSSIRKVAVISATPETSKSSSQGPATVVAVFSTKGGVGKTTVAANLAAALACHCGVDTALVDLDLEFGGAASMFGVHPQATIVDLCRLDSGIDNGLVEKVMVTAKLDEMPPARSRGNRKSGRLKILAAPQSPDVAAEVDGDARRRAGYNYVDDILAAVAAASPYVVIDMGSSFRETNLTALDRATTILLITTPDILSLQNTGKCLEILLHRLEYPAEKITLLMNQADTALGVSVQEISRGLDFPVAHRLPRDARTVIWAANCGQPFVLTHTHTKVAEGLIALAKGIVANGQARKSKEAEVD
ncbi:MAG: hypothetical protein A2Y96_00520 [Firmicutes bacterium RBG_13_65_8]|nr:MAG: hypothetical protein A2Y96_00520 [Firmicutes bacterium RBG_13_65_8]